MFNFIKYDDTKHEYEPLKPLTNNPPNADASSFQTAKFDANAKSYGQTSVFPNVQHRFYFIITSGSGVLPQFDK
jgi:hypothetical protein